MNGRSEQRRLQEAAIIGRMALARTRLLAANLELRDRRARKERTGALTLSNIGRALLDAPTVTLLVSIVLGSLIVGPKRIVPVVARAGFTGWVARNVRTFIGH